MKDFFVVGFLGCVNKACDLRLDRGESEGHNAGQPLDLDLRGLPVSITAQRGVSGSDQVRAGGTYIYPHGPLPEQIVEARSLLVHCVRRDQRLGDRGGA